MTTDRVALATLIAAGALFAGVLARVAQLQHAPGDELRAHLSDRARDASVAAPRGAVYDRRDRLLASSDTRRRLFLDPLRFPRDDARAVRAVAAAAGLDASLIEETVSAAHAENDRREGTDKLLIRYRAIGGLLPDHAADAVAELPVPGVHLERRPVRESGAPESLAPVIGKVAFDHSGLLGLERALETDLAPRAGRASVIRDADGDPLWIEGDRLTPAARGRDVTLSVDARLQRLAERALAEGLEAADAAAGRLIAIDPRTGEILAMLDRYRETEAVPFDPELVPEDADDDWPRFDVVPPDPVREKEPALARVRCAQDAYEPGSTFKPIIWSAVLERRAATLDETLDTHGGAWRTDYGRLLRDVVERDSQTVFDVLVNSSNIGMAKLAARLEDQHLQSAIRKFGFGAPTGLRLPREESGIVTPARALEQVHLHECRLRLRDRRYPRADGPRLRRLRAGRRPRRHAPAAHAPHAEEPAGAHPPPRHPRARRRRRPRGHARGRPSHGRAQPPRRPPHRGRPRLRALRQVRHRPAHTTRRPRLLHRAVRLLLRRRRTRPKPPRRRPRGHRRPRPQPRRQPFPLRLRRRRPRRRPIPPRRPRVSRRPPRPPQSQHHQRP